MNTQINITENGTTTLATAGKYCDRNIDVHVDVADSHYDEFWDAFQQNGERTQYTAAFTRWNDVTYNPKYDITGTLTNLLQSANISSTKIPIVAGVANMQGAFYGCDKLVTIVSLDMTNATNTTNTFFNNASLENITFVGEIRIGISLVYSPKLTNASVQSIIDHLADLTGQTAQILTLHTTVGKNLTDAQKATITAKNWTLVY